MTAGRPICRPPVFRPAIRPCEQQNERTWKKIKNIRQHCPFGDVGERWPELRFDRHTERGLWTCLFRGIADFPGFPKENVNSLSCVVFSCVLCVVVFFILFVVLFDFHFVSSNSPSQPSVQCIAGSCRFLCGGKPCFKDNPQQGLNSVNDRHYSSTDNDLAETNCCVWQSTWFPLVQARGCEINCSWWGMSMPNIEIAWSKA